MAVGEVRVLGTVDVVGEGGAVHLARKHARLLAALVVARGQACSLDELADAMWSGSAPKSARKLVQLYVSQLRRLLPAGIEITTQRGAYVLELGREALDSASFDALVGEAVEAREANNPALALSAAERALSLWRGRAFGELGYEDFARAESERLEERRLEAVEERLTALLALGRANEALADALAHAEQSPLRERAHELVMLGLYRSGRQSDALEHFAGLRARLRDELGLEPGPALRALQRRILEQDPELELVAERMSGNAVLPLPPNPLVGRDRELDQLAALLARRESRLIVLTGAGGSGKTRLALEAARRAAGSFANGVRLVELAPLSDAALVVPTIARALGVRPDPWAEPLDALAETLARQELLLVVDNAEHVSEAAPSYAQLVALAPRLTVLVTSRAVLHVSAEHVFPVAPLEEEAAVELFAQRARLLEPTLTLARQNEDDVREICRRVDCLPLAIELAAARIRTLTPRALRERLSARLGVLTVGPRDLPARQRTLRETIAWSVDLLGENERLVFSRLAVFPGGASLEAAEEVCDADLDTLAALVDGHLIVRREVDGRPRFEMLETIREYALSTLREPGIHRRHARFFASLAEEASSLQLRDLQGWVEGIEPERDNVRAALAWSLAADERETFVRLAVSTWRYWWVRWYLDEGRRWLDTAADLASGQLPRLEAAAFEGAAALAWACEDWARAGDLAERGRALFAELQDPQGEAACLRLLGHVSFERGDYEAAERLHVRCLCLYEEVGSPMRRVALLNAGWAAAHRGDADLGKTRLEQALELNRAEGDRWGVAMSQTFLAHIAVDTDRYEDARAHVGPALSVFREMGFVQFQSGCLEVIAAIVRERGDAAEAARLLGAAESIRGRRGDDRRGAPTGPLAPGRQRIVGRVRDELGEHELRANWAEGGELSEAEALDRAQVALERLSR